jgi:hypothetical protein
MDPQRQMMIVLNLLGGIAVLGSYVHGFVTHPATRGALWGNVPLSLQPVYTASMLLAAVGYLSFTSLLLFRVDPGEARVGAWFGYGVFNLLYALILVPSALWMPLTFVMIDQPSRMMWSVIRIDLGLVALGSLGMLAALVALQPRGPAVFYWLAVAGAAALCVQTALLDGLFWPAFFPVKHG